MKISFVAPASKVNARSEISKTSVSLLISTIFKSAVPLFLTATFELYGKSPDPMNSSNIIFR